MAIFEVTNLEEHEMQPTAARERARRRGHWLQRIHEARVRIPSAPPVTGATPVSWPLFILGC